MNHSVIWYGIANCINHYLPGKAGMSYASLSLEYFQLALHMLMKSNKS